MAKLRKKVNKNEDKCKNLHTQMNMKVGPTKLVDPKLYIIVDTDELQKQVNSLENKLSRMERMQDRKNWTRKRRRR